MAKSGKKMSETSQLLSIRLLVVFFIAVSSVLAIIQAKSSVTFIAQLMGISWGALAGTMARGPAGSGKSLISLAYLMS